MGVASVFTKTTQDEIEERIANWRRFYASAMRFASVPYYTPPEAGDVMQDDIIVKIPLKMQDAVALERCWRNLDNQAHKWYLKWFYIDRVKSQALWRKLKVYGARIRSDAEHDIFHKRSLEYFHRNLVK